MKMEIVVYTDDLSGEEYRPEHGETVTFALRGVEYEVDLTTDHVHELENFLTRYMRQGRRVKQLHTRSSVKNLTQIDKYQRQRIRQWAIDNGEKISTRGAISQRVLSRYNAEAGGAANTG